jgi:V8-like Glu-specific endopeptidase
MRRVVLVLATMALAILLAGGVAQAIINGEPDRGPNAHPYVGAYVAKVESGLSPVCSGTLISPRVFLTAGHCTEFAIKENLPVYVSFDPTYKQGSSRLTKENAAWASCHVLRSSTQLWASCPATSATT